MNKKNLLGVVVSLVIITMFAGCSAAPAPEKTPEEIVKEGVAALADVTSYKYEVSINGDMKDPVSGDTKFDVKLNGAMDDKDIKDPKIIVNLDGTATDGEGTIASAKGELMMNKDAVYFNLKSLDLGEEGLLPSDVTDKFGKWWMITLPPEVMDEMEKADAESDAEVEKMKKALEESNVFSTPEYIGLDNVMGESSYNYKVSVDKKGLLEFIKIAAEKEGQKISASDLAEAEEAFEKFDIAGEVWIGSTSGVLNKVKGVMTLKGGADEPSGTINFEMTLGDINKPVSFNVPSGAEEFPVDEFLGPLMMMGGLGNPSMMAPSDDLMMDADGVPFDPTVFDEAAFEDALGDTDPAELEAMMKDLEAMGIE